RDLFGKIEQPLTGITAHLCAKARWSQQQLSVSRSASFPHGAVQSGEHFALQTCEVGVGEVIELAEFSVVNHDFVEECFALALTEPAVEVFPFVFAYEGNEVVLLLLKWVERRGTPLRPAGILDQLGNIVQFLSLEQFYDSRLGTLVAASNAWGQFVQLLPAHELLKLFRRALPGNEPAHAGAPWRSATTLPHRGDERGPLLHKFAAPLEQISAPITALDLAANVVGQTQLDHVVACAGALVRPVT